MTDTSASPNPDVSPSNIKLTPPGKVKRNAAAAHGPSKSLAEPVIKSCDMPEDMRAKALELIVEVSDAYSIEREMALKIKRAFDAAFGPKWHVVVGRHFASHVSYEPHHYIYVQNGQRVFLIFKSGGGSNSVPDPTNLDGSGDLLLVSMSNDLFQRFTSTAYRAPTPGHTVRLNMVRHSGIKLQGIPKINEMGFVE